MCLEVVYLRDNLARHSKQELEMLDHLICQQCGGTQLTRTGAHEYTCSHCGSVLATRNESLAQSTPASTAAFSPDALARKRLTLYILIGAIVGLLGVAGAVLALILN
jgi:ribosomal protein L37AE/L43A